MTQALVTIIKVNDLQNIPDSDFLNVANIGGYQIVVRKQDFQLGDLGLFISVDSVVPYEFLEFYNLHDKISKGRVKTIKLRGVYSQGLLLPLTHPDLVNASEGDDLAEKLNIRKYVPEIKNRGTFNARPWPTSLLKVYDIESLQSPKYRDVFEEGEEIVITEKIHGMHMIAGIFEDEFFVCSRKVCLKRPEEFDQANVYWRKAIEMNLESKLRRIMSDLNVDSIAIRGELFGPKCQFMHYGRDHVDFAAFDIEAPLGVYLDNSALEGFLIQEDILGAFPLYYGPFSNEVIDSIVEGHSRTSTKSTDLMEGVVIKSTTEKHHMKVGRKILKQISKKYALAAGKEMEYAD